MRGNKGISAIVATVLIILITVAAVTIIWIAIIPMIQDKFGGINADTRVDVVTTGGYTFYDSETGIAMVQVKRNAGTAEMRDMRITFNFEGDSYGSVVPAPAPNQLGTYSFNLTVGGYPAPYSVSVAPIFIVGSSSKEGISSSKIDVGTGKIAVIPDILYELGKNYESRDVPDCTHADNCTSPGTCKVLLGAACTDGSCAYQNAVDGTTCNDGNPNTENDQCTAGGCAGTQIPTGCQDNGDCNSPGTCQTAVGATCNTGTGVCTYPAEGPTCASVSTTACGTVITSTGCPGTCPSPGTYCAAGSTCTAGSCVSDTLPCNDGDIDGYCLEAMGTCDATGKCANGYDDCNDGNVNEYTTYPANTYYLDGDGDGYGTTLITSAFCSDTAHVGAVTLSGDCAATNPAVNPGATESAAVGNTCDDGLNNDCDAFTDCAEVTDCAAHVACSTTALTSCGTISASGEYYIASGDWGTMGANCFTITADDVHIDGNGEYMSVTGGDRAFYLDGVNTLDMVTGFELSDLVFEIDSNSFGIYAEYSDDFNIHHNNFTYISGSTNAYGIRLQYGNNGLVYGNRFINLGTTGSQYGIYFYSADGNSFTYNYFFKVFRPFYIYVGQSNNINDNEVIDTLYDGLYLYDSYNAFRRNRICNSVNYDVYAVSSSSCTNSNFPSAASGDGNACSDAKSNCAKACELAC